MAPAVALAVHGRGPLAGRARFVAFGASRVRTDCRQASGYAQSLVGGRYVPAPVPLGQGGRVLGGAPGAAIAVAGAVGSAFAGSRLRVKVQGPGLQLVAAAAEDALSYSLVLAATRSLD